MVIRKYNSNVTFRTVISVINLQTIALPFKYLVKTKHVTRLKAFVRRSDYSSGILYN